MENTPEVVADTPAPEQAATAAPAPEVAAPAPDEQTTIKTFTQEEVDALIGKRLARERRTWERERTKAPELPAAPAPVSLASCPIKPAQLAGLVKLTDDGVISKQQAKEVFAEMFKTGQDAAAIVDAKGLRQNSDTGELEKIVQEGIADPAVAKSIAEYRAGNEKAINALKGPIMKRTQGKANPGLIDQLLRKFLG